jgi:hypothetical protein
MNIQSTIEALRQKNLITGPAHAGTDIDEVSAYVHAYGSDEYAVVMIDCPYYVAVSPTDAAALVAAGYELA